jgi:hypothetical protein
MLFASRPNAHWPCTLRTPPAFFPCGSPTDMSTLAIFGERLMHAIVRGTAVGLVLSIVTAGLAQVKEDTLSKIEQVLPKEPFAKPKQPRKLLIYSKTLGYRHGSIPTGMFDREGPRLFTQQLERGHSEDPALFDENRLKQFDAVLFLNTTGDCLAAKGGKLNEEEQAALERRKKNLLEFVAQGKGFAGVHAATDTFYSWKEYGDMIGAWFTSHPWGAVPLKIDSPKHPLTSMFKEEGFEIRDEIYMFGPKSSAKLYDGYQPYSRGKLRVLLSVDEAKFKSKGAREDNDYAISWIREYGKGRVFYCALGHGESMYMHPDMLKHYLAGLQYALGDLPADATPSAK